jgi:NADH-quinone oxidoreductase subunit H
LCRRRRPFAAFSVVPFGTEVNPFGLLEHPIPLEITDVNVAVLVIFAITSMGIYGIVLAGWSSNSKYSCSADCVRRRR